MVRLCKSWLLLTLTDFSKHILDTHPVFFSVFQSHFNNASPYSIMFGPDKCGSSYKLHLIVCDGDPLTGLHQERHVQQPNTDLREYFSDQQPHLYTLRKSHWEQSGLL